MLSAEIGIRRKCKDITPGYFRTRSEEIKVLAGLFP